MLNDVLAHNSHFGSHASLSKFGNVTLHEPGSIFSTRARPFPSSVPSATVPASLDFFDKIIGTLLGLLLGALFMGLLAILLKDLFVFRSPASEAGLPIIVSFQGGVRSSTLVTFFGERLFPLLYRTVRLILPSEADFIFRVQ
jgi:hypothetical protein